LVYIEINLVSLDPTTSKQQWNNTIYGIIPTTYGIIQPMEQDPLKGEKQSKK